MFFLALFALGALVCSAAVADVPTVSNVSFTQGPNGTTATKVDINYDLVAPNGPCNITVSLSKTGGADGYIYPVTTVTGDLAGVVGGAGPYHIEWDISKDYPNEDIPEASIRITADDAVVQHTLTYTADANGTINGVSPQTVNDGADGQTVTAVADPNYHFTQWSDGLPTAERTDTAVTADITVTALFEINQYTLTYTADANGSITGPSPQTVNHGADGEAVTAVADPGYQFVQWSDGGTDNPRTDTNVTGDISVSATFAPGTLTVFSFVINNDAETSLIPAVKLNNVCTGVPTEYLASESSSFTGAVWTPYATAPTFTLSGVVGSRTVYFKVRDAALAESGVKSDTIALVPETVPVAAGSFMMGRPYAWDAAWGVEKTDELPVHSVTLDAYQIGKYEVTNQQCCDVLNWALAQGNLYSNTTGTPWSGSGDIYAGPGVYRYLIVRFTAVDCNIIWSGGRFLPKTLTGLPGTTFYSMANHPMVRVTWYGSVAFCNWLSQWQGLTPCYNMSAVNWPLTVAPPASGGYRLPTEAEWERAAAWDETQAKHWAYGCASDTLAGSNRANYGIDPALSVFVNPFGLSAMPYTSIVGWFNGWTTSPNGEVITANGVSPAGAYDMCGNAGEWCGDWYSDTYYNTVPMPSNPTGPATGTARVLRGGSWTENSTDCRSAFRLNYNAGGTTDGRGFRMVRTP